MNMKTLFLALPMAVVLATVGCERPASTDQAPERPGEFSAWSPAIAEQASLSEQLPANTIAYLRLPGVWGLVAAPKQSAVGRGLDTPANREAITALQSRLPEILAAELGPLAPALTLLLEDLRSPLEVALVGDGPQPLEADLVIEGRFDFATVAELDAVLGELAGQASMLKLIEPAEDGGTGQLLAAMFPIFYDFDPSTRRARFLTGMSASAEGLAASRQWQASEEPAIGEFERRIDASGHGLFLWADMARLGPIMRQGLDASQLARLETLGVFATRQLALGYGSSAGKGKLAVLAEGREGNAWELTLPALDPITFRSSGEPDVVFGARLPDSEWLERLIAAIGPEAEVESNEISARLEAEIGLSLKAVVDAFAGRMLYIDDDNGGYLVHETPDLARWRAFWDALSQRFEIRRSTIQVAGSEIHHVTIPGIDIDRQLDDLDPGNPAFGFLLGRMMRAGTHLFWMQEDERILIAPVPQVLMARLEHPGSVEIGAWLDQAGVNPGRSALFGALSIEEAPRRNYYAYISTLLGIADMLETEIDVADFPTARELDLPGTGNVGFSLDYVDGRLGATLSFENHPGDLFYAGGGSLAGIAVFGILAAVAVPAYQDYLVRARVAEAYAATADFRGRIATHVAREGALPTAPTAGAWAATVQHGENVLSVMWQSEPAGLRLILAGGNGMAENAKLVIEPAIESGRLLGWSCSNSTIDDEHLPAACR